MNPKFILGQILVFIVIGSLIGYSPLSAMLIFKMRRATDSHKRFYVRAAIMSLVIALFLVAIYDFYSHFIPWSRIPDIVWYVIGLLFIAIGTRKYVIYHKTQELKTYYNAGWYILAGVLIAFYETMDPGGAGGIIVTTIIILLAIAVRFMYWKQIHAHAKDHQSINSSSR